MGILRYGVARHLEDEANRLLVESMAAERKASGTHHHYGADILLPWKERDRRRREIIGLPGGVPDSSVRSGNFHRAINVTRPHLNSREGPAAFASSGTGGVSSAVGADAVMPERYVHIDMATSPRPRDVARQTGSGLISRTAALQEHFARNKRPDA